MSQRAGDDPLANPTLVQATKKRPVERPIVAYPGFHVLDQQEHWDEATRQVIMTRINQVPAFRFFKPHEIQTLQALAARVLPQDDRPAEKRIPIAPWIDQRCYLRLLDGWRFDDMPPDDEAWRLGLLGIDEVAIASYGQQFILLRPDEQDHVLRTIAGGQPPGEVWRNLPPRRFWIYIVLRQMTSIYYAHPTAWDEIGFGGPAYPRGYFALNHGYPEPWEVREVRLDETSD